MVTKTKKESYLGVCSLLPLFTLTFLCLNNPLMSSWEREDKVKWDLCLLTSTGSKDGLGAGKECTSVSRREEEVGLDLPSVSYCCFWLWTSLNHEAICFCMVHLLQKRDVNAHPHRPPACKQTPLSFCFLFSNSKVCHKRAATVPFPRSQKRYLAPPSWPRLLMLLPQLQFIF